MNSNQNFSDKNTIIDFQDPNLRSFYEEEFKLLLSTKRDPNVNIPPEFIDDLIKIKILFHPSNIEKVKWIFDQLNSNLYQTAAVKGILNSNGQLINPSKHYKLLTNYLFENWAQSKGFNPGVVENIGGIPQYRLPPGAVRLTREIGPQQFALLLRNLYFAKDIGVGNNEHGEFTHVLQWYLLITYNEKFKFLNYDPLEIYKTLGNEVCFGMKGNLYEGKFDLANIGSNPNEKWIVNDLWEYCFDLGVTNMPKTYQKQGFSCVTFFNHYLMQNKDTPILSTLISSRVAKRENFVSMLRTQNRHTEASELTGNYNIKNNYRNLLWKNEIINTYKTYNQNQLLSTIGTDINNTILQLRSMPDLCIYGYILTADRFPPRTKLVALTAALMKEDLKEMIFNIIRTNHQNDADKIVEEVTALTQDVSRMQKRDLAIFFQNFINLDDKSQVGSVLWTDFLPWLAQSLQSVRNAVPQKAAEIDFYINMITDKNKSTFEKICYAVKPFIACDIDDIIKNMVLKSGVNQPLNILSDILILTNQKELNYYLVQDDPRFLSTGTAPTNTDREKPSF